MGNLCYDMRYIFIERGVTGWPIGLVYGSVISV